MFSVCILFVHGQKNEEPDYSILLKLKGSDYVVATVDNTEKIKAGKKCLLFIDTKTGAIEQVDFMDGSVIEEVEHVKIDSLGVDKVVVIARTASLTRKKTVRTDDPRQILIFSVDGKSRIQLTIDKFFVKKWLVDAQTGNILISGYYDLNMNRHYDEEDKNEILIYNLETLQLITKI